jgi:hypothetical protein
MSRHSLIATLGPAVLAQQLAELKRLAAEADLEVVDGQQAIDCLSFPAPEEPMMLSGRPGTNRHTRRAQKALARRMK